MIGFSLAPLTKTSGIGCTYQDPQRINFFPYDQSSIKIWLDGMVASKETIFVNDSHDFYKALSFLGKDYLRSLKLFDNKAFFNIYRNALNINVYDIGLKFYKIDAEKELERLKKIWFIQGEQKWAHIPIQLIEVYLEKDAITALRIGEPLATKIKLDMVTSSYIDFLRDFIISMVFLEEVGVIEKKSGNKIIPRYEYDHVVTGRIVNTEPFCFQTVAFEKFAQTFVSRFGDEGMLVTADWANADFRVAAALAQEKLEGEKLDPYTLIGKLILNKSVLTDEERNFLKTTILSIMYGYEGADHAEIFFKAYPKIAEFKKWIINEAQTKKKLTTRYGKTRFFEQRDKFTTKAFNTINQMTVADLCKKAVIEMQDVFTEKGLKSTPIPWICYDSFGFDVYLSEKEQAFAAIREVLIDRTIPPSFRQFCEWDVKIKNATGDILS